LDRDNSVDKRTLLDPDRFGYLSLHYVCGIGASRRSLPEYRKLVDLKCEIQIRSILQHTWAEIEHDLGYKTSLSVPQTIRRRFSRLAGLLELADSEFAAVRDSVKQYQRDVPAQIKHGPDEVLIDQTSLIAYIDSDPAVKQLDQKIVETLGGGTITIPSMKSLSFLVRGLLEAGFRTIAEVQKELQPSGEMIVSLIKYHLEQARLPTPNWYYGVSLSGLVHLSLARKGAVHIMTLLWKELGITDQDYLAEKLVAKFRNASS
jgi:hypothetical protein